jgi:hypothetical protein
MIFPDIHDPNPLGEQLDMAYRDVSRFDDNVELSGPHQDKIDRLLNEYRARHAFAPVVRGDDGKMRSPVGSPDARWASHRGSPELPQYDPWDPQHTQVPMIVLAWDLDFEWAVRGESIEDAIRNQDALPPDQPCDWHFDAAKPGTAPPAVMCRAQGQIILLLHVCGSCRDILDRTYGGGLLFFELEEFAGLRRVQIPQQRE